MYDANEEMKSHESTFKTGKIELWWDKKIAVQPAVECNRPDIVFWELETKKYCVPMDVNVKREEKEKSESNKREEKKRSLYKKQIYRYII